MYDSIEHLKWRYAVKKFDSEKVLLSADIKKLKLAFNLTATSYGLQPIKLVVISNKKLQNQLVSHSFNQQQVAQASHVLVICIENHVDDEYIARYFDQIKKIRGTSDEILNPFKEAMVADFSNKKIEEIRQWSINQAYLAMGNLLTICALEKIDSCPMEGFESESYDEILGLKERGLTSVLVLPVGYRASDDMFSNFKKVRRHIDDSIIDIF
ncbi:nitroreductase family protein [uncultured Kriegella sp.]|uniref:nitroreductase family protein n=1 Tax=uncultured Kriegella sp. TaxID=1798910 RepID=UPI0030DA6CF6|tara:strand:+ start:269467 stop:270102 length:636 start_codon:yes stop_codon:yes gene_type:complete